MSEIYFYFYFTFKKYIESPRLTLKNCVNCESVAENRNIDALYKNKAFLQNELTENNKLIKSLIPNYIPKKSY